MDPIQCDLQSFLQAQMPKRLPTTHSPLESNASRSPDPPPLDSQQLNSPAFPWVSIDVGDMKPSETRKPDVAVLEPAPAAPPLLPGEGTLLSAPEYTLNEEIDLSFRRSFGGLDPGPTGCQGNSSSAANRVHGELPDIKRLSAPALRDLSWTVSTIHNRSRLSQLPKNPLWQVRTRWIPNQVRMRMVRTPRHLAHTVAVANILSPTPLPIKKALLSSSIGAQGKNHGDFKDCVVRLTLFVFMFRLVPSSDLGPFVWNRGGIYLRELDVYIMFCAFRGTDIHSGVEVRPASHVAFPFPCHYSIQPSRFGSPSDILPAPSASSNHFSQIPEPNSHLITSKPRLEWFWHRASRFRLSHITVAIPTRKLLPKQPRTRIAPGIDFEMDWAPTLGAERGSTNLLFDTGYPPTYMEELQKGWLNSDEAKHLFQRFGDQRHGHFTQHTNPHRISGIYIADITLYMETLSSATWMHEPIDSVLKLAEEYSLGITKPEFKARQQPIKDVLAGNAQIARPLPSEHKIWPGTRRPTISLASNVPQNYQSAWPPNSERRGFLEDNCGRQHGRTGGSRELHCMHGMALLAPEKVTQSQQVPHDTVGSTPDSTASGHAKVPLPLPKKAKVSGGVSQNRRRKTKSAAPEYSDDDEVNHNAESQALDPPPHDTIVPQETVSKNPPGVSTSSNSTAEPPRGSSAGVDELPSVEMGEPHILGHDNKRKRTNLSDGDEEYEIERIMVSRCRQRGDKFFNEYLVRWQEYSADHDLWVGEDDLKNAQEFVLTYNAQLGLPTRQSS
ncbi:hypothetical protein K438DRAFT_1942424, partial [Mycena galopus ATCC 62051]